MKTKQDFLGGAKESFSSLRSMAGMSSSAKSGSGGGGGVDASGFSVSDVLSTSQRQRAATSFSSSLAEMVTGPAGSTTESLDGHLSRVLRRLSATLDRNECRQLERDHLEGIQNEWQHVALVVDRLLLLIFIVMTLGITGGIVFQAPLSWTFVFGIKV